eukprot:NODE_6963_length_1621_cov_6.940428.p1 GENE.NODE_6963_length_1621_cov_6.940428~~NODE_6963_length_1621_cov_6.940428.p1  ORF type:complete len:363 (-),score=111.99 NODE_6963_length_1621_cov_6.940428:478-1566(-)
MCIRYNFNVIIKRTGITPESVGDVQIGNVLQSGAGAMSSRQAQLMGGMPFTVPLSTVNRQCSSGLQAVANIASSIKAGIIDVGIGGGVESMSFTSMGGGMDPKMVSDAVIDHPVASKCFIPMGITSENVAEAYGITRAEQDALAAGSFAKALAAQEAGRFDQEIVPVTTKVKDQKGDMVERLITADDGPRPTSIEALARLKPAFKAGGTTTAGNSSQVTDGAALVLMARRATAKAMCLPILGRFRAYSVVGVDPAVMGIGPSVAIPAVLAKAGLKVDDIDVFEINEAFASQALMSANTVGVPLEKLNPNGGGIALGHPLGCTGARQIATLLPELKRTGTKLGVVSMCIGTGMGAAGIIESEQ